MGFHFVLVHGAMHGAWCWYKIVDLLLKDGHRVTALDLASAGTSPLSADSINSLDEYHQPLFDFLSGLPLSEKVVIVGHSLGGMALTLASEALPDKIAVAVYVCAVMVYDLQTFKNAGRFIEDIKSKYRYHFADGPDQPPTSAIVSKEFQEDLLYGTSPSWDGALSSLLLRPYPLKIFADLEIKTTEERYGSVPRVYVKAGNDKAMPTTTQDDMIAWCPPKEVYRLDCDHSPFFSAPRQLSEFLLEIARKYSEPEAC